jgi:nucleoside-diphosphate-sugar epimerase
VSRIAELAQGCSAYDVPVTMGPGILMKRCEALDISRARQELGFEPRYDVATGIRHYADWMQAIGFRP